MRSGLVGTAFIRSGRQGPACMLSLRTGAKGPAVQFRCPADRGVVGLQPLDDLDPIPVRVGEEKAVRGGNRRGFLRGNAPLPKVSPGSGRIPDAQGKVPRTGTVGPLLE